MSKIDKGSPMSSAALISTTRSMASELVRREAYRSGSRTVAYDKVAQAVGVSSSWLRKFLADSGEAKEPRLTLFHNIRAAYDQLCLRVELENEMDALRMRALKRKSHAVTEGIGTKDRAEDQTMAR
jgi:hypothetical protein